MTLQNERLPNDKALSDTAIIGELIRKSRGGDLRAMEALYERFKVQLFNLAYRHTYNRAAAEDILQEIFLKVFTHLHTLQKEETFVTWLYRLSFNTCYSYLRERKADRAKTIPLAEMEEAPDEKTSEPGENAMKRSLNDVIQSLPDRMKTVFVLHDVQGFKHGEIAGVIGCSAGTSKSQLFKARMKIRDRLREEKMR